MRPSQAWTLARSHVAMPLIIALITLLCLVPAVAQQDAEQIEADDLMQAEIAEPTEEAPPVEAEPTVNIGIRDGPFSRVTHIIEQDLGAQLVPRGAAAELIIPELVIRDATLDELLNTLQAQLGWQWFQDASMPENMYELYTDEDYRTQVLPRQVIEKSFYLENISASVAAEFVAELLSEVGSVAEIPRTNEIIVVDLPQYVEEVERLLQQIDVRLYIRVFQIQYADVMDVADALERFQSPEGTIEVNERLHTIIAEDLFQNLRRMDLMVELLDQGTVLRTYPLNYLSEDDINDLVSALEQIVTPDALLEVEWRTGMIILDDTEEVHEKAAELIAAYDQPTRQIMLQADVIQVSLSNKFDFSTEIAAGEDLLGAAGDGLVGLGFPTSGTSDSSTGSVPDGVLGDFPIFTMDSSGIRLETLSSSFRAVLTASISNSNTRLLLSPRLQVKDKEQAIIDVGGEVPFVTTTINNNNSGTQTYTQQAVRVGLLMEVTPYITNTGYVELQVRIENNTATQDTRTVPNGQIDVIGRETQQIETTLLVPDGGTRVIAGLITTNTTHGSNGIPFLSELPYVGWLFGSVSDLEERDNLMIFLTPTILVESATDYEWAPLFDELPVSARFRTPLPEETPPVYPPDLALLLTSSEGLGDGVMLDDDIWWPAPDQESEMSTDDEDSEYELMALPPLGPGPVISDPGAFRGAPPVGDEEVSGEANGGLPLVDVDLRGDEEQRNYLPEGVRTSYSDTETPRIQGRLEVTDQGGQRHESGTGGGRQASSSSSEGEDTGGERSARSSRRTGSENTSAAPVRRSGTRNESNYR